MIYERINHGKQKMSLVVSMLYYRVNNGLYRFESRFGVGLRVVIIGLAGITGYLLSRIIELWILYQSINTALPRVKGLYL